MCNHLTQVARQSECRYAMQCEHGTVQLVWGRLSVRVHPRDVQYLAALFERWEDEPLQAEVRAGELVLLRDQRGGVQCWLAEVGIRLAAAEVPAFALLIADIAYEQALLPRRCRSCADEPLTEGYALLDVLPQRSYTLN